MPVVLDAMMLYKVMKNFAAFRQIADLGLTRSLS